MSSPFVFHDPTGARWARTRRVFAGIAAVLSVFVLLFLIAALTSPHLPVLGLPEARHDLGLQEVKGIIRGEKPVKNVPFELRKAAKDVKYVRSNSPVLQPRRAAPVAPAAPVVFGYYVNWDRASMVSLRMNVGHLTHLVTEWFTLKNAGGDLDDDTDNTVMAIARQGNLPVLGMVTNYRNGWQAGDVHKLLNSRDARENLIDNIHGNLEEHGLAGVNIDLEQVRKGDRDKLIDFMRELRLKLNPEGYLITQSIPVGDPAYDARRLAEFNDYIMPMVYDEHYQSGEPGPVASEPWFEEQLNQISQVLPPQKTVIAMGSYGYDWIIGGEGGTEVSHGDVMAAAHANQGAIEYDAKLKNPVLRYSLDGKQHETWFLDGVTGLNQILDTRMWGFRGVALWRLGGEDPALWQVLSGTAWPADKGSGQKLKRLTVSQSVTQYGEGEVLRVTATPQEGSRNVWRDAEGDYLEQYQSIPSYYVLESVGGRHDKELSITFDDGPDARYTPRILDILRAAGVPAAFFIVGVEAEAAPSLIRRIYQEGHLLGNHTYSHPNVALVTQERTNLELDATLRLIEHLTGRSTILFRPPYNADSEPQTPDELIPIVRAQKRGYITIGERIDPQDWRAGVKTNEIVHEVMSEVEDGNANVILLHDGGGNRTATIEALPEIIERCRAKGYRFVSLGDLIGKSRDDLMPVPPVDEKRWADLEAQAFDMKGMFLRWMGRLFLAAIYLTVARSLVYAVMAIIEKIVARRRRFDPTFAPPVSVVLAAYNEEKVIGRTIDSLLRSNYPELEIVVVDDGSKDRTWAILQEIAAKEQRVRAFTKPNGGKSAALNMAIRAAQHSILVAVDADTLFAKDTIREMVKHFHDPRVAAVSGNAKVGNRKKWITRFQSIEYVYGFNLDRRALDLVNGIPVVPGAVGAWRKSLVLEEGGFGHDTLAEDTDLTLALLRKGYVVRYEEKALAYTEAPEDMAGLRKQRFRWSFGTLQAVWKHRDALLNPKYGSLAFITLPNICLFQVALSVLAPFADIAMIFTLIAGNWHMVLLYYFAFFLVELLSGCVAYALEEENPKDLALLFFQRLFYRQLMNEVLLKTMLYALRGRLVGWGKLERTASVQAG
jgi:cellulose synthase/poly-beta-1,6-N-acetylglucosamine synthase-like glycosyltransferase/spore germination protein YaaH/peptidoglycan/xylan/chitin deacetylase (PgdA/CDA1 family)